MGIKSRARKLISRFGLDVNRLTPMWHWHLRLPAMIEQRGINLVIDVGASDGGFASDLLEGGYRGRIISFEPLPDAWEKLKSKASRYGDRWSVAPRMALSDTEGSVTFNEAGNSKSSSLLVMNKNHIDAAPDTATIRQHHVQTKRLDDVLHEMGISEPIYLKIDVQGAEHLVLRGAPVSLSNSILGLQLEMSLIELYDSQQDAKALDELMAGLGFNIWDIVPGFRDPRDFRLLQYDGVYFRG